MNEPAVNARIDRLAEEVRRLSDIVSVGDYTIPVLNAGEPRMLIVDSLDEKVAADNQYFDLAVRGTPDVTYKSLRGPDGEWSWRLLSTGRYPFTEQGRDEGLPDDYATWETMPPGFTQSSTEWVTLLDATLTNAIPARAFAMFTFSVLTAFGASPGSLPKNVRILFDDEELNTIELPTGDPWTTSGYFAMFIVGPNSPWGGRSVEGVNATWNGVAMTSASTTISRIRIQARTQDPGGGDAIFAANLITYA